jgi:hypothetical protein
LPASLRAWPCRLLRKPPAFACMHLASCCPQHANILLHA